MEQEIFKQELAKRANQFKIELSVNQVNQFYKYMQLLLEWNKKMNLTAITEPEDVLTKHFIDSISVAPYINKNDNVLDIGTGAGFPGIPLKIVLQDNSFTLLDSLNKRINFLNVVIEELNLNNIKTFHCRAEEFSEKEGYQVVVSRAVAKLNVLLEYMLPFTKIGGRCICMKSSDINEEIEEAKNAINILGGEIEKIDTITLENTDIKRKLVVIKKIKSAPNKYPRKAGMPSKEPIC